MSNDDLFDDLIELAGDDVVNTERTQYLHAPFSMPGAKFRSLKHILPKLPYTDKWVDHFGGTGVVSWNRAPCMLMVYNDRYSAIGNFYRCLQNKEMKSKLLHRLKYETPPHSREEFLYSRATWVTETDPIERAAKWYYMMRVSVIGKGHSFARATNCRPPMYLPNSLKLFEPIHQILQHFQIENLDVRVCARDYDSIDCVHYFDPPYIGTDPGIFEHKWTINDQKELLSLIGTLQGFVAFSHYPSGLIDSQSYWNEKYTWDVAITSEAQAYMETNYRKDKQNVQEIDYATECLWIKEPQ